MSASAHAPVPPHTRVLARARTRGAGGEGERALAARGRARASTLRVVDDTPWLEDGRGAGSGWRIDANLLVASRQGFLTLREDMMARRQQLRIVGSGRSTELRLIGDWEEAPLEGLCASARVAAALEKLQRELVRQARSADRSWADIGASLGISKQTASERFS